YDLFVIGAGSGGVRAARLAAELGARVAIAEEYRVGGTCVIRGCVPKKLLVYGAHFAEDIKDAQKFGWLLEGKCDFDWPTLRDNVLAEVDRLNGIYIQTLESHDVEIFHERATLEGPHEIKLGNGETKTAKTILIATGAWPYLPDFPGSEHAVSSNEVFHLETLPQRVLIAGAGYIANEFAGIFNELSCQVTLINRSDVILRQYDQSIRDRLLEISMRKGIDFRFNAEFESIEKNDDGSLHVEMSDHSPLDVDLVLIATGRKPNTDGIGLDAAGVEIDEKGAIVVDDYSKSSVENIYAVGDVTNRVQLTPVAIREGQAFAETVFNDNPTTVDYGCIPSAVFSHPPLAAVGMTEAEARNKLGAVKVYQSDFRAMKNVLAERDERALYKMICDADTGRVVGLHMIGPESAEILQAAAVAVKAGLTKEQFDDVVALHPTMAEELVLLR
ncbi:MAG: glutathione-disulfide reductase, partial [Sphingomonadaceae bacterium]|nr:glutathione-disulfide reductase [Sphingomonadaceae bacterium]